MEIRLLGPLEIVQDGQKLQLPSGLPRALLTLLALTPGEALRTERIVDLLWGDSPPPSAAGVVQTYVSRLRKVLGDEAIRTVGSGYALELDAGERDVDAVVRLRAEAKDQPREQARATLLEALAMFRGTPLADVAEREFAQAELRRLEGLRSALAGERLDVELDLGRHAEVLPDLESRVAAEPLDEAMRARLMLALYRSGRQAEALDAYHDARAALGELGLEPGGALRRLQRAILEHDPSLGQPGQETAVAPFRPRRWRSGGWRWAALVGTVLLVAAVVAAVVVARAGDGPRLVVPANSVAVVELDTGRVVAAIPVGTRPQWMAAGAGSIWVTSETDRTVSRIDPASLRVTASIGLGFEATDIVAAGPHVWVVGGFDHTLWRIDADGLARRKLQFSERFGPLPQGYEKGPASLTFDGHAVWLAHGNEVTRRDAVTGEPEGTIRAGGAWFARVAIGTRGYVFDRFETGGNLASENAQFVQLFDANRLTYAGRIVTATVVSDILVADGSTWVSLPTADAVWEVDDRRGILVKTFPAGDTPVQLEFADDALWVANTFEGTVRRINRQSGESERVIQIGHTVIGLAVSGDRLFVAVSEP